jgi:ankyrin repeat protein
MTPRHRHLAALLRPLRVAVPIILLASLLTACSDPIVGIVDKGDTQSVERLLAEGADVNARNRAGDPLLAVAIRKGHLDIVRMLLDRGADVNVSGDLGVTPLMFAASSGNLELTRELLRLGADATAIDSFGNTALIILPQEDRPDIVKLLLDEGVSPSQSNHNGQTPLMVSAWLGQVQTTRLLIEAGADVNATARNGQTAMMRAAMQGREEIVDLLLSHGADPGIRRRYRGGPCPRQGAPPAGTAPRQRSRRLTRVDDTRAHSRVLPSRWSAERELRGCVSARAPAVAQPDPAPSAELRRRRHAWRRLPRPAATCHR